MKICLHYTKIIIRQKINLQKQKIFGKEALEVSYRLSQEAVYKKKSS